VSDTTKKNTDAGIKDGAARSSEEAFVMKVERRSSVILLTKVPTCPAGMNDMTSAKPCSIAKSVVREAYRRVKANRGAAGIDDETIVMLE
jgi:RNA-directed DNA polymerase